MNLPTFTRHQLFLFTNCLLSLMTLVSISIWTSSSDVYTLTHAYNFYWFLSISSVFVSFLGILYHMYPKLWAHFTSEIEMNLSNNQKLYSIWFISVIFSIFWLAASSSVANITKQCRWHYKWHTRDSTYSSCTAEIMATVFGFFLFFNWFFVLTILSIKSYSTLFSQTSSEPQSMPHITVTENGLEMPEVKQHYTNA